ncbi:MAG: hypothetical protein KKD39_08490 [Candidatus Altiarchaeota archaeon]|nr:hypothetical protein [Candidatus Altiarchaeota archaeon]
MKVLVTAGPTREYIDDVRYITNASSGLMGAAIAQKAHERGWEVTLVLGPTHIIPPEGLTIVNVVSAEDMIDKTLEELDKGYDMFVSAAAIADYTPEKKTKGKIRSGKDFILKLKSTRKLVREVRSLFPSLKIVAFKAEYGGSDKQQLDAARLLLTHTDYVVLNDLTTGVFGSDINEVTIISREKDVIKLEKNKKEDVATRLLDIVKD